MGASTTGMSGEGTEASEAGGVDTGAGLDPACGCGWSTAFWDCVPGDPMPGPPGVEPSCPTEVTDSVVLQVLAGADDIPCDFGSAEANFTGCCYGGLTLWCAPPKTQSVATLQASGCDAAATCFPNDQ
ncbi:MAG: hypothetical protein KUG77_26395, partial [Nannocystaceae bacterium]|nr:hypothetical protein [Nannocystaceae bacterium]